MRNTSLNGATINIEAGTINTNQDSSSSDIVWIHPSINNNIEILNNFSLTNDEINKINTSSTKTYDISKIYISNLNILSSVSSLIYIITNKQSTSSEIGIIYQYI